MTYNGLPALLYKKNPVCKQVIQQETVGDFIHLLLGTSRGLTGLRYGINGVVFKISTVPVLFSLDGVKSITSLIIGWKIQQQ